MLDRDAAKATLHSFDAKLKKAGLPAGALGMVNRPFVFVSVIQNNTFAVSGTIGSAVMGEDREPILLPSGSIGANGDELVLFTFSGVDWAMVTDTDDHIYGTFFWE